MTSLLVLLLAVAAAEPSARQVEVRTLSGEQLVGKLQTLTPDRVIVETDAGLQELPADRLLSLAPAQAPAAPAAAPPVVVELAGGSRLLANEYTVSGKEARIGLPGGDLPIDLAQITSVQFAPSSPDFEAVWTAAVADATPEDRLVVKKKDGFDFLTGVAEDVGPQELQFNLGMVRPVKREKVAGIVYFRPAGQPPKVAGRVLDAGGSLWAAKSVELAGDQLRLEVAGQTRALPWSEVRSIDFSAGKIQLLGEPETAEWTPFLGTAADLGGLAALFTPRVNTGFDGGPLLLGGKEHSQGLALRSRSRVTYRLPPGARRFQATAGIDDRYAARGHVVLRVLADGRTLFDEPVVGGAAPKALDLDVTGARRLEILVDFGEGGDLADHLNLCEARVTQ
ncbi:MAG: NPCBM/NEW2 domain-containing protein [Pirellulales bacterium]